MTATYATSAGSKPWACLLLFTALALAGCSVLQTPPHPVVYDFGPGAVASPSPNPSPTSAPAPAPIALAQVQAASALDTTAVLYRLAYSDAQQLRPYALARWSMPPAELVLQRLRAHLGQRRAVLNPMDGVTSATPALTLRLELDEFSQLFEAADKSTGLLRLRATLAQTTATGETLLAQRSFVAQRSSPSADAAGGVKALAAATDAAVGEIELWVQQTQAHMQVGTPGK